MNYQSLLWVPFRAERSDFAAILATNVSTTTSAGGGNNWAAGPDITLAATIRVRLLCSRVGFTTFRMIVALEAIHPQQQEKR